MQDGAFIQCWTDIEIPPWSCFFGQGLLYPSAQRDPVLVVGKEPTYSAYNTDSSMPTGDLSFNALNTSFPAITNGSRFIPANEVFTARSLLGGIHWLAYEAAAGLGTFWFVSSHNWTITAANPAVTSLWPYFYSYGASDDNNKCIPVMLIAGLNNSESGA